MHACIDQFRKEVLDDQGWGLGILQQRKHQKPKPNGRMVVIKRQKNQRA